MSTKNERRREQFHLAAEEEKHLALTTPRHIHDDLHYAGVGLLLLKLIRRSSRDRTVCYELRGTEGSLRLFRSISTAPGDQHVTGHDLIAAEPVELGRFVRAIDALSVPIRRRLDSVGVLDGETYELAAYGGTQAVSRFSWRGGYAPECWHALAELVEAKIKEFDSSETKGGP